MWHLRAEADKLEKSHWYRGQTYDFDGLVQVRQRGFGSVSTDAEKKKTL
jgi:hypothetical protein